MRYTNTTDLTNFDPVKWDTTQRRLRRRNVLSTFIIVVSAYFVIDGIWFSTSDSLMRYFAIGIAAFFGIRHTYLLLVSWAYVKLSNRAIRKVQASNFRNN